MRKAPHLALLFALSLFAACTCISAKVENKTGEPIFVNAIGDDGSGGITEDFGYLVMPRASVSLPGYGKYAIRARDMRGDTVFYSPVPDDEDSSFDVTSLEPVADARPLGSPITGRFGWDSRRRLKTCRASDELTVSLFGMLATIQNESEKALVVNVDRYPSEPIHNWKYGVFAAPGQTVQVFAAVTEEPYVRAFDQEGRLVYTEPVPLSEKPTVVIPRVLPPDPPAVPAAPYNNDCMGITGLLNGQFDVGVLVGLAVVATVLGAFAAGALIALVVTVRFLWEFYVRKGSS